MDGNKDEALRCVNIAKEAIAAGNKARAAKFIKIAQRLNKDLEVKELLAACERLEGFSASSGQEKGVRESRSELGKEKLGGGGVNGVDHQQRSYTDENVQLVRQVKRNKDYYAILGVEKTCSVEEIRKAYRKLSLKVHPDKNKAPGSEEAFKIVSKAFKCLSDVSSRRQYDQTGFVEEFEYNQQHNVRRRTARRSGNDFFDDDFDPDEIFRAFFGQSDMFRASQVYRTRGAGGGHHREEVHNGGPNIMLLIQILPFLVIMLLAYLPFTEPDYSLQKNYNYQIPKTTERHGVEFFVKSQRFDDSYPLGSSARAKIEDSVIKDYKNVLVHYCRVELQRRHWNKKMSTPHCDKLNALEVS
ncbi:chaperone protein dnaJ 49 [Argentina anserina]|uniref:chaperone protein dnaJ 49 n=1 Tax=Argentina anserina TaxID=57926 RepID=UPI0021766B6D|nr:chaperone protein dnaJ 49 [Potentilla anserina]XP_050373110.1 chaperone protein dnaJ 49 [Potentilla anserina]